MGGKPSEKHTQKEAVSCQQVISTAAIYIIGGKFFYKQCLKVNDV